MSRRETDERFEGTRRHGERAPRVVVRIRRAQVCVGFGNLASSDSGEGR